jgi:hypothetical protein
MKSINLSELMRANCYDAALAEAAKKRDVAQIANRFAAGACATSAANPLHYTPEIILDLLDATERLNGAKTMTAMRQSALLPLRPRRLPGSRSAK